VGSTARPTRSPAGRWWLDAFARLLTALFLMRIAVGPGLWCRCLHDVALGAILARHRSSRWIAARDGDTRTWGSAPCRRGLAPAPAPLSLARRAPPSDRAAFRTLGPWTILSLWPARVAAALSAAYNIEKGRDRVRALTFPPRLGVRVARLPALLPSSSACTPARWGPSSASSGLPRRMDARPALVIRGEFRGEPGRRGVEAPAGYYLALTAVGFGSFV